ncbi:MAG: protein kinase [Gemmatimonadales bacterium]|nr:protein kinase [Gemmatimonadales bacterium]MBA3554902.1 protein kinase [Gemmatimonadales bacterium]
MTDLAEKPLAARLAEALGDAYTIEGEIGRGGMGVVYRARDERLQRRVAIKVLPPELAFQQDIRERFTREAQTAAKLSHPHIVPIHTVGEGRGLVYFVMGFVDGESVAGRIRRRGRLPVDEARRIMTETADALSAAHGLSIIHRDIKPDNILLEGSRGRVMVTDFGIAKALSGGSGATLTGAGVAIGTPAFMSPEQAAGEREIDGRSDLYSLGIVTFQMLTSELPFNAPTVAGILMKQITEVAPDLRSKRHDVPEDLALAVSRCLEKDPENRWPTADALRRALESRTVVGYQPTGLGWRASRAGDGQTVRRPDGQAGARPSQRAPLPVRPSARPSDRGDRLGHRGESPSRRRSAEELVPDTGEPRIVQKVRGQFASWAAVSLGCMGINVATGLETPWFLFPTFGMGLGLMRSYARLWQSGYSWRDVLTRPAAPDAVETTKLRGVKLPRQLPQPAADDYGAHLGSVIQAHSDRLAIVKLMERLPPSERKMLPEIQQTVDALYERATDLARTLHAMDTNLDTEGLLQIDERIAALSREPDDPERARRLNLLQRQRQTIVDLQGRRNQVSSHLESCVLAMQNVRFDLLRLRSAGVAAVLTDLTQATQQAKALSRDVDNAIAAAGEIREAMK